MCRFAGQERHDRAAAPRIAR